MRQGTGSRTGTFEVAFGTPEKMAEQAAANRTRPLLRLEFLGDGDVERVRAVRQAAPAARLIVDANESWNETQLRVYMPMLVDLRVALIE
jgi:L-alanine-DL-glutamate epimerase-like enolase superfamily enzyme